MSLASITDPELVATAVAVALNIQQAANRTLSQRIADQLPNFGAIPAVCWITLNTF